MVVLLYGIISIFYFVYLCHESGPGDSQVTFSLTRLQILTNTTTPNSILSIYVAIDLDIIAIFIFLKEQ